MHGSGHPGSFCLEWIPRTVPPTSASSLLEQQLLGALGLSSQAPLDEERLMEPRGCQQPLCSLVKAEFLALTSMLSQLLEKQRKLICVNDRTENLAG